MVPIATHFESSVLNSNGIHGVSSSTVPARPCLEEKLGAAPEPGWLALPPH
jgi:hypothetical protein